MSVIDAIDGDAEAAVIGDGGLQECDGAGLLLVGKDVDAGDARMVVDGDVSVFPTDATGLALAVTVAGDAVASSAEFTELFYVDMDDLAGIGAFITWPGSGRLD